MPVRASYPLGSKKAVFVTLRVLSLRRYTAGTFALPFRTDIEPKQI